MVGHDAVPVSLLRLRLCHERRHDGDETEREVEYWSWKRRRGRQLIHRSHTARAKRSLAQESAAHSQLRIERLLFVCSPGRAESGLGWTDPDPLPSPRKTLVASALLTLLPFARFLKQLQPQESNPAALLWLAWHLYENYTG